jgi:hypothetical protein
MWFSISFIVFFIVDNVINQLVKYIKPSDIETVQVLNIGFIIVHIILYLLITVAIYYFGKNGKFSRTDYIMIFVLLALSFFIGKIIFQLLMFTYALYAFNHNTKPLNTKEEANIVSSSSTDGEQYIEKAEEIKDLSFDKCAVTEDKNEEHIDDENINEELFYQMAYDEVNESRQVKWIWSKSFANADGDKDKATASYIRDRVQDLIINEKNKIQSEKKAIDDMTKIVSSTKSIEDILESNDYLFLGKDIVRKKGTFDDYKVKIEPDCIKLIKNNTVCEIYKLS